MTQWIEEPEGGRGRGPVELARAWGQAVTRPRRFFRNGVAPGDQAPGLVFAVAVSLAYVTVWFALAPGARPVLDGRPALSVAFALVATGLLLAPLTLHLAAALATVSLMAVIDERAGVSRTVQVVAYAAAPCALAGPPVPALRLAATAYGAVLLVIGLATVHRTSLPRAALAALLPGALVFGYGFGGFAAATTVAAWLAREFAALGIDTSLSLSLSLVASVGQSVPWLWPATGLAPLGTFR